MAKLARRLILSAALAAPLLIAACNRAPDAPPKPSFKSIDITGADYANKLDLPDVDGHMRHLSDFKGKIAVVFFGYTQCPDVCPTTMLELAQAKKALGADGAKVIGVFVTVDPERDTPAVLKAYVANFSPDFIALRGTPDEVKAAAKNFKVFYSKVPGATPQTYTIDHTAGSYVFDTQGRVRLFTRYGSGVDALTSDLRTLLAEKS